MLRTPAEKSVFIVWCLHIRCAYHLRQYEFLPAIVFKLIFVLIVGASATILEAQYFIENEQKCRSGAWNSCKERTLLLHLHWSASIICVRVPRNVTVGKVEMRSFLRDIIASVATALMPPASAQYWHIITRMIRPAA